MFYPEKSKAKFKEVYPDSPELYTLLDGGKDIVGAYLAIHRTSITFDEILSSTSLEELQAEAKVAKAKEELWREWQMLFEQQYS